MRIAVATEGNMVAQHFGRCPEYTLVDVSDGQARSWVVIPNPGHEPGFLPRYLADMGVTCIIAGGMGPRAQRLFEEHRIQTVVGAAGYVREVVESYIKGQLRPGPSSCEHGSGCPG